MSLHDDTGHGSRPGNDAGAPVRHGGFWRSRGGIVAIGFLLAAAFLLFSEHRAHPLGYLPLLLLLACPVYVRLARREEVAARAAFGPAWDDYARCVPAFLPRIRTSSAAASRSGDGPHD